MKQKLLLLLCLLAMPFVSALGDEYTDAQGVKYTLNDDGNTYRVSGHTDACTGDVIIPETVNGRSVTAIGMIAFCDCTDLISVTIPDGVTSIGTDAFYNCKKLSSINIPTSVTYIGPEAFMRCEDLESIIIPTSVTKIEPDVFKESGLTSINIPTSVTRISSDAFNDSWLYSVTIPNSVSSIGEKAFFGCNYLKDIFSHVLEPFAVDENVFPTNGGSTILHVPAGTKSVYLSTSGWSKFGDSKIVEFGSGAEFTTEIDGIQMTFAIIDDDNNSTVQVGCWDDEKEKAAVDPTAVDGKSIVIPEQVTYGNKQYTVTRIGAYAFKGCQGLVSVSIPNTVTNIEYGAFQGCSSLTTINIPEGVTAIEYRVFCYCDALTTIEIPEGVTSIGGEAFRDCSELASITIPNSVTSIGYEAFRGCNSLTSITIPDGVTAIEYRAFRGCSELASITIPNSVTSIGYEAFRDCNSLTSITIPDGVTSIGGETFRGCSELASITIPNSVTSVGNDAFRDCIGLSYVYCYAENVPTTDATAFDGSNIGNATLFVPEGSIEAYQASESWSGFKNILAIRTETPDQEYTDAQGVKYTLNDDGNTYTVSGHTDECTGNITILEAVNGCRVTTIGNRAFYGCRGLTSITIPNSVTSIGEWAFSNCSGLTSITIPASVTSISDFAFHACNGITSITIPASVTSIGDRVFNNCSGLTSIIVEAGNSVYDSRDNCNAIIETTSKTLIRGCKNTIIPNSVTSIGRSAFDSCFDMTSIVIPNSVTSIGSDAFYWCNGLTSITIPNSVTSIQGAFGGCYGLTSIIVEAGNSVYDSRENCNAIIEKATNTLIAGCQNTTIPNSVTSIGQSAFFECFRLTSITIPCNVTSIGDYAFFYCSSLTSITIPSSLTSIGNDAFRYCSSLKGVYCYAENVPTTDATAFVDSNIGNATLFVPEGSIAAYQAAAPWSGFKNIIAIRTIPVQEYTDDQGLKYTLNDDDTYTVCGHTDACAGDIIIPEKVNVFSVTAIGYEAFSDCSGLTSLTIPASVTRININDVTFRGCSSLASIVVAQGNSVYDSRENCNAIIETTSNTLMAGCKNTTIPSSVTSIGLYAFCGSGLTSLTIPNGVTSIGHGAFRECSSLASIFIPSSVTSIGDDDTWAGEIFHSCSVLTSITVEEDNPVFDSRDNCNAIIKTATNTLMAGCKNTRIPSTVTSIADEAFFCSFGLTSVMIPASVTSIGERAFGGCYGLTSVTCYAENVPTTEADAFESIFIGNATLYVPEGSIAAYRAALPWSGFKEIVAVPAQEYTDNQGLIYSFNGDGTYTVSGHTEVCTGDVIIPETVNGFSVTSIGEWAFTNCHGLTSITIPNSVTSIGEWAFTNCHGLTSIDIPNSVTSIGNFAFGACNGLTSIIVEEGNTVYDSRENCNAIIETTSNTLIRGCKNTIIPNSVTSIGSNAFYRCFGMTSIVIPNSVTSIGSGAFYWCNGLTSITIPSSVTSIGNDAFANCSGLTSIIVEEGNTVYDSRDNSNAIIEKASNTLMAGCKNTTIPSSVTSIGLYAFCGSGLTSLTIPNGVTSIGHGAFRECSSLASIFIPSSVTSIGDDDTWAGEIFHSCSVLTSITVEEDNPVFDSRDNCNAIIKTATNTLMAGCKNTRIPSTVTSIADEAFFCSYGLTSVMIPSSVTSIGNDAFANCSDLTAVKVVNSTPIDISSDTFENTANATLYVPKGSKASYSSATGWQDFLTIKEYPDGDVNQDGEIDVIDVVDIARFVVGTPSTAFEEFLADLDGSGAVNVADAIVLVNDIAGDTNFARSRAASSPNLSDNVLSLTGDGSALSLQMDGDGRFAAFQFDLRLPSDMDVMKLSLNDMRRQGHQLLYNKVSDSHYRVVALSTSGNAFNGVSGELLGITLDDFASDEVYLDNIHFVTTEGIDVPFDSVRWGYATSILRPEATSRDDQPVYNLNGQRLDSPRKGVNIIGGKKIVIK